VGDENAQPGPEDLGGIFSPEWAGFMLRQAIVMCWGMLPEERRTATELQAQIWRIVERALKDQREDADAFGTGRAL